MSALRQPDYSALSDPELATLIASRDSGAVRLITRRCNQQLFRAAWAILRDRAEAEDAVQSAYLSGFAGIGAFEGRSSLCTWFTRIAINEALGRQRKTKRRLAVLEANAVTDLNMYRERLMQGSLALNDPDAELAKGEIRRVLEKAIEELPERFRIVFVLRDVEGLSIEETANVLDVPPATIKTRHLRARRRLQSALAPELKSALTGSFPFAGASCAAMTERVLAAVEAS